MAIINKVSILIACLLTMLPVAAQEQVGGWLHYPVFAESPSAIVATADKTYYLVSGRLYSYSISREEFIDYVDVLTDTEITLLALNKDKQFLAVGYSNGNVDLLYYGDDTVVNMPDIKNATVKIDKGINDIEFDGDNMMVATKFGLVIFDTVTYTVKQSGIFEKEVVAVGMLGDYIFISLGGYYYYISNTGNINLLSNFTKTSAADVKFMTALNRQYDMMLVHRGDRVAVISYNFDTDTLLYYYEYPEFADAEGYIVTCESGLSLVSQNALWKINGSGVAAKEASIPAAAQGDIYGTWLGAKQLWSGSNQGVAAFDLSGDQPTVLAQHQKPYNSTSVERVAYIIPSLDGNALYFCNVGPSTYNPAAVDASGHRVELQLDMIDSSGMFSNIAPTEEITNEMLTANGRICGGTKLINDPDDPDKLYIGTGNEGIYVVKDGKQVGVYNSSNTPFPAAWGVRVFGVNIDPDGNLWVVSLDSDSKNSIFMLPSAKRKLDPLQVKASDWKSITVNGYYGQYDTEILICKHSDMIYFSSANVYCPILAYDTNGTYSTLTDDSWRTWFSFTDQDGKTVKHSVITCIAEDDDGKIWVGSHDGLFVIPSPVLGTSSALTVEQIKVPRNDGTNYADYLLDGEHICGISVDADNRKWIATKDSGLYLVSADGTEILESFTMSNSSLPTNTVNAVHADKASNAVYVGTNQGVLKYTSMYGPSSDDFSDVYAYPNPVRPGYSGWITITNLMDGSLVKIADASGSVVYSGRSEGGMLVWDGCNSSGRRVKSGVYYVFVSATDGYTSSGAVTKILIMN